jgi:phage gpG-like protein
MIDVKLIGQWELSKRILNETPAKLGKAIDIGVKREANYMLRRIVQRFRGGIKPPLSPLTVKRRRIGGIRGSRPLVATSDLRNAITVVPAYHEAFVGVLRTSGRYNIAVLHENGGTVVIKMTARMRRFLFGVLFRGSVRPPGRGGTSGIIVVRIPARPFIGPVFDSESGGAPDRMLEFIAKHFGGALGTP